MVKNFDHLAKLKYSPVNPTAFTERGLYMLATILKGRVATQTTINIINTFVEIRELSRAIARVPEVVDENEKKSLLKRSGEIISNVLASDSTSLESETEIELNLAMVKIRHKIKKKANHWKGRCGVSPAEGVASPTILVTPGPVFRLSRRFS